MFCLLEFVQCYYPGLASLKTPAILLLQFPLMGGQVTTLNFIYEGSRDPAQVLSWLAKQFTGWDFRLLFCFVCFLVFRWGLAIARCVSELVSGYGGQGLQVGAAKPACLF